MFEGLRVRLVLLCAIAMLSVPLAAQQPREQPRAMLDRAAAKARAALLPVGPDARVPMRQIYDMFRGELTPEQVLEAAGSQASAQFYAQLYVGLYFEALRDDRQALEHIMAAAVDRYADAGGYMHAVAKVHLGILTRQ